MPRSKSKQPPPTPSRQSSRRLLDRISFNNAIEEEEARGYGGILSSAHFPLLPMRYDPRRSPIKQVDKTLVASPVQRRAPPKADGLLLTKTGRKPRDFTTRDRGVKLRQRKQMLAQRYTPQEYSRGRSHVVQWLKKNSDLHTEVEKQILLRSHELAVNEIEEAYDKGLFFGNGSGSLRATAKAYHDKRKNWIDRLMEKPEVLAAPNGMLMEHHRNRLFMDRILARDPELITDTLKIMREVPNYTDSQLKDAEEMQQDNVAVWDMLAVKSLAEELKAQMKLRYKPFGGFPPATSNNLARNNFYMPTKYPSKKRYSTKYRTGKPVTFTGYKRAVTSTAGPNAKVQKFSVKSKIPGYSSLSKTASSLVDQIIDPSNVTDVVRWPNTYGLSATYKCRNIIKANYDPLGNGLTVVHPRIGGGIQTTYGQRITGAIGNDVDLASHLGITQHVSSTSERVISVCEPMVRENAFSYPITAPDGSLVYYNPFRSIGGNLVIDGKTIWEPAIQDSAAPLSLQLLVQANIPLGAASISITWLGANFLPVPAGGLSQETLALPTISSGIYANVPITISTPTALNQGYMGVAYYIKITVGADNEPFDSSMTLSFSRATAGGAGVIRYAWPNVSTVVVSTSLKDADAIQKDSDKFIVMAQSLLVTSQMSSNNNSGQCSTARLPGGSKLMEKSAVQVSPYEWLASLPYNSYNGPVKNGSYTFYLPDDERGYQYQQLGAVPIKGLPYLVAAYFAPDDAHSIRIQVDTIVQFTTNASLYQLGPSPQLSDLNRVHYLLSALQASYTNDGHIEGLKRHLANLGGRVKEELLKPSNWARAGKAVMKYGPMLASAALI